MVWHGAGREAHRAACTPSQVIRPADRAASEQEAARALPRWQFERIHNDPGTFHRLIYFSDDTSAFYHQPSFSPPLLYLCHLNYQVIFL